MSNEYDSLLKQVVDLQYKIHDSMDRADHPQAQSLRKEVQDLVADAKTKRNPRDIENRIQSIQHHLHEAHDQAEPFMSVQDADHFHHVYEDMRMQVRNFEHY